MKKRGQFFILAAVIISAIIISLAVISNYAEVSKKQENFYDMASEVQRESGAVIDYEIYSDFDDDANLTDFVKKVAEDKRDQDPNAVFLFIYGDSEEMTFSNFGNASASVSSEAGEAEVQGGGSLFTSYIYIGSTTKTEVKQPLDTLGEERWTTSILAEEGKPIENIEVEIKEQTYTFPVSRHRQVIFIIQKEEDDESFVSVG